MANLPPLGQAAYSARPSRVPDPENTLPETPSIGKIIVCYVLLLPLFLLGKLIQFLVSRYGFLPKLNPASEQAPDLNKLVKDCFDREIFSIATADGQMIDVTFYKSKQPNALQGLPTVVFFHGRDGHTSQQVVRAGTCEAPAALAYLRPYWGGGVANFNLLEINYRGQTSTSETSYATAKGLVLDGDAAIQCLHHDLKVPLENLRLLGFSMGGGEAAQVAKLYPKIPKLCIINSFRSLRRVVWEHLLSGAVMSVPAKKVFYASNHMAWKCTLGWFLGFIAILLGFVVTLLVAIVLLLDKMTGFLGWDFDTATTLKKMPIAKFKILDCENDEILKGARLGKSRGLMRNVVQFVPPKNDQNGHAFDFGAAQYKEGSGVRVDVTAADVIGQHFDLKKAKVERDEPNDAYIRALRAGPPVPAPQTPREHNQFAGGPDGARLQPAATTVVAPTSSSSSASSSSASVSTTVQPSAKQGKKGRSSKARQLMGEEETPPSSGMSSSAAAAKPLPVRGGKLTKAQQLLLGASPSPSSGMSPSAAAASGSAQPTGRRGGHRSRAAQNKID